MPNIESGGIPPEEMIDFEPNAVTASILESCEPLLSFAYHQWKVKKIEDLRVHARVLESVLEEGEKIARVGTLKIGDKFKIVTTYPRDKKKDKEYTVDRFSLRKRSRRQRREKPHLFTTTGVKFPLDIYVIIAS